MVEPVFHVRHLRPWLLATAGLAGIVYGGFLLHAGILLAPDSRTYARWADTLVRNRFDYGAFLATEHFVVPPFLYVAWVTVVAISKALLGEYWTVGVVVLNLSAAVALVYALTRTTAVLTQSVMLGIVAALAFLSSLDVLMFLPYVLSDIVFMTISGLVLLHGLSMAALSSPHSRRRSFIIGTLLLLLASVFRPTAAPLVVFWVGCVVMMRYGELAAAQGWKGLAIAAALGVAGILVHAGVMQDPSRVPAAAQSGWIQQLSVDSHKGIVVYGRPDTYVPPPQSYMDFTQLTLTKWAYYFAPWMSGYSRFHKFVGGAFFVVVYALSLLALFRSPQWKVALLLTLFIGSF